MRSLNSNTQSTTPRFIKKKKKKERKTTIRPGGSRRQILNFSPSKDKAVSNKWQQERFISFARVKRARARVTRARLVVASVPRPRRRRIDSLLLFAFR